MSAPSPRSVDLVFRRPRFDRPIAVEDQIRLLPAGATCKGLFFNDPIQRLKKISPSHPLLAPGEIAARRYVTFFDYSYADFMRLLATSAQAVYPSAPLGEGLRRLGRTGYEALMQSQVGKVVFGVLGRDFESVVRTGVRGWVISVNFGKVELEVIDRRQMRYHFRDFPAFLESYQVGVVEGAMGVCGIEGEVLVHLHDPGNGVFEIRW
jgi:uncharacterized protein (TIGR02265 family)